MRSFETPKRTSHFERLVCTKDQGGVADQGFDLTLAGFDPQVRSLGGRIFLGLESAPGFRRMLMGYSRICFTCT
jgi:hypothetical protein